MSESGDYEPAPYARSHDFTEAKKTYDRYAGRSYEVAKQAGKKARDFVLPTLTTTSTAPVVIVCDVTGSMKDLPSFFFSKAPYLVNEVKDYLGDDAEISFAAVGDATCDTYPLQVHKFTKDAGVLEELQKLVLEGGGGSDITESYELAAYYYAHQVSMPNAKHPILIFLGDEIFYDKVNASQVKRYISADAPITKDMPTAEVFALLKKKFAVYFIRKPYSGVDSRVRNKWISVLGEDHVCELTESGRIVDVVFGILAKEAGRMDDFQKEIEGRQRKDQVEVVYKSLGTIHKLHYGEGAKKEPRSTDSVTRRRKTDGTVKRSEPLD